MFRQALRSRSSVKPQSAQTYMRWLRGMSARAFSEPQQRSVGSA